MTTTVTALPLTLSEASFQQTVIETALLYRWRVAHFRPARTASGGWSTPMIGHPGWPDLALARDGQIVVAELKRVGGRLSPSQREWLAALGAYGRVWTPAQWPSIWTELRDGPTARTSE